MNAKCPFNNMFCNSFTFLDCITWYYYINCVLFPKLLCLLVNKIIVLVKYIPASNVNHAARPDDVTDRVGPSIAARPAFQMQFKLAADENSISDSQHLDKLVSYDNSIIFQ